MALTCRSSQSLTLWFTKASKSCKTRKHFCQYKEVVNMKLNKNLHVKILIPLSEIQLIHCLPTECNNKCILTQYDLTDYFHSDQIITKFTTMIGY